MKFTKKKGIKEQNLKNKERPGNFTYDQEGPLIYALYLTEKGLQIFMCRISGQKLEKGPLIDTLNLTKKGLQIIICRT